MTTTADPKRWTQKNVAEALGVARSTVDHWFNRDVRGNATSSNTSKPPPQKPDARVKLNPVAKAEIVQKVAVGKKQAHIPSPPLP